MSLRLASIAIATLLLASPVVAQPAGNGPGDGPRGYGWGPGMMMGPGMMGGGGSSGPGRRLGRQCDRARLVSPNAVERVERLVSPTEAQRPR